MKVNIIVFHNKRPPVVMSWLHREIFLNALFNDAVRWWDYTASATKERTSVERRSVDADSGKMGDPAPLSALHISHMDGSGIERGFSLNYTSV
jgi:hypothetical protein